MSKIKLMKKGANFVSKVFKSKAKSKGQLPPPEELRKIAKEGMSKFKRKNIK